jgi:hypothetical protein
MANGLFGCATNMPDRRRLWKAKLVLRYGLRYVRRTDKAQSEKGSVDHFENLLQVGNPGALVSSANLGKGLGKSAYKGFTCLGEFLSESYLQFCEFRVTFSANRLITPR